MRVNLSLNSKNDKDRLIINLLEEKYNAQSYIKEILYQLAKGNGIGATIVNTLSAKEIEEDPVEEEFEEMIGIENIEL